MKPYDVNEKQWRLEVFRAVKKQFNTYLGRYTHQKMSDDWHFRGLAFVRDDLGYVFGFNLGFFLKEDIEGLAYSHVGLNVLVRTNGNEPHLRMKYKEFFENHLKKWISMPKSSYTSFRGGVGIELPRMKRITDFETFDEITEYLTDSIIRLNKSVYPHIIKNPSKIFSLIVRGAPLWDESITEIAEHSLQNALNQEKK